MKNVILYLMFLAFVLFQISCKDFWHPEGPTLDPKADYATITVKTNTGRIYTTPGMISHRIPYELTNIVLRSADTGNNFDFPDKGNDVSLKVPSGTYYVTAQVIVGVYFNYEIRSDNFSVPDRGSKILSYYYNNDGDGLR